MLACAKKKTHCSVSPLGFITPCQIIYWIM
uniref:Uncharacterized protein n=1 Tax=Arundo donax TaxID=35708 RepID=A0A0A9BCC0_ARUDO